MRLHLPPEMGGGNPQDVVGFLGLDAAGSPPSDDPTAWTVGAPEGPLLTHRQLAGPPLRRPRFDIATAAPVLLPDDLAAGMTDELNAQLQAWEDASGGLYGPIANLVTQLALVPNAAVPAGIETVSEALGAFTFDDGERVFPAHSVHDIRFEERLHKWVKLPQMILRLQRQPFAEVRAAAQAEPDRLSFESTAALVEGSVMGTAFFAPLLGNASPGVWGFGVPRLHHSILFAFGRPLNGLGRGVSRDLLDVLAWLDMTTPSVPASAGLADYSGAHRAAYATAIDWWAGQLEKTLRTIYDPTNYVDPTGTYLPAQHHRWMLNFEQLLSRVSAISRAARDPGAQLILAFSAMDLIGDSFRGSGNGGWLFAPDEVAKAKKTAAAAVTERAQPVIMAPAERALKAAEAVAEEFFLPPLNPEVSVSKRVGRLMAARRNATHGFLPDDDVLVEHSGRLPADLALVPYVYLRTLLTDAGRQGVRKRIAAECARPPRPTAARG